MLPQIKERIEYFEKLDKETGSKHHVLYMEPDYDSLIWENDTVLCGGNDDGFCFEGSPDTLDAKNDVNLKKDPQAEDWLYKFYECCLIPINTEDISREDLSLRFDWDSFHFQGLQIALRIAHQLPDNCELWYTTPFEDVSKTLPKAIMIKNSKMNQEKRLL